MLKRTLQIHLSNDVFRWIQEILVDVWPSIHKYVSIYSRVIFGWCVHKVNVLFAWNFHKPWEIYPKPSGVSLIKKWADFFPVMCETKFEMINSELLLKTTCISFHLHLQKISSWKQVLVSCNQSRISISNLLWATRTSFKTFCLIRVRYRNPFLQRLNNIDRNFGC